MTPGATPNFASTLKRLRATQGMTQDELAERSGVSVRSISDLERGISRFPHKDTVQLLAAALQLAPAATEQLIVMARAQKTPTDALTAAEAVVPLIGREREVAEICARLCDPHLRLLTLTGIAGIGKTRLASECASLIDGGFADGVKVVDLAAMSAARYVMPAIAQVLGIREQPSRPLLDAVIQWLAERRLLLVLDNCEHVLAARAEIALLLTRCPHLTVLATSREKLDIADEHVFSVPPLGLPASPAQADDTQLTDYPAIQLFIAYAGALHGELALTPVLTRTIAKICARLEGIPLAIELAAAQSLTQHPRAILAQLSGSPRRALLALLRHNTSHAPQRQQTLRDALAWSYRLLDAREQIVFRRLSVFVGGWTAEAADAICDPHATLDVDMPTILTALMNKSLIRQEVCTDGSLRYSMLFVVRAYGTEVLAERRESGAIQRRYAEYYTMLARQLEQALTGATQAESLQQLIQEYENVRGVLQWAREQQAVVIGLQLAGALWWFWENRGYLTEGRDWLEGMITLWRDYPQVADDETVAHAYYGATILAITQGDFANGTTFGEACLAHMHAPAKRARVLLLLGNSAKFRGNADESLRLFTEGLAALRALDDAKGILVALNNLSTMYIERGDMARAMPLLEESLALKRALGDRRGTAVSLMNQGEVLKAQADYPHAQAVTTEGLTIFTELGDAQGMALAWNNLGEIAAARGDDPSAITAFAASLMHYRRMEDRPGIAMTLLHLGQAYTNQRDAQAISHLQEGATIYEEIGNVAGCIECLLTLATFHLQTHAPQAATYELQRVAALIHSGQSPIPENLRKRYAEILSQSGDNMGNSASA